jgi:NADPH:quinone reductase
MARRNAEVGAISWKRRRSFARHPVIATFSVKQAARRRDSSLWHVPARFPVFCRFPSIEDIDMLAIEISRFGGPEVLKVCERPTPVAGKGEVLVRVSASGVNRPDVFQRGGNYAPPPGASDLPGLEIAGEIVDGDLDSADNRWHFKKGDRVCALLQGGGYAQYAAVPLLQCLPVPGSLSDVEAASLPENYFTVWSNVMDRAGLGRGEGGESEVLLVQGGTSGIGVTAVQIA